MKILYHQSSMTDCCTQVNYSPETYSYSNKQVHEVDYCLGSFVLS